MTPTATYIAEENCLQELPKRERPDATKILGGAPTGVDYEVMDELMDEYYAHLATLRKIPCDPSCKGLWADGQKLVDNVDYEVRSICGYHKTNCSENRHCEDCRLIAFPLVPVKSEDELWREALNLFTDCRLKRLTVDQSIAEMAKVFSLTKR